MAVPMRDIRAAARQIARQFRPQRIVLFGSHADGTPGADSDVDLLVRSPAEIARPVAWGDCFLTEIPEKGKVL